MINNRGIALYLVLGILFMTILLAQILFTLVLNQAGVSHHQVSRTQALFAARAGMIYALDRLSDGSDPAWQQAKPFSRYLCRSIGAAPCNSACSASGNCTNETALPASIKYVNITVFPVNSDGVFPINSTANYTSAQ